MNLFLTKNTGASCPDHPHVEPMFTRTPESIHHGRLDCPVCGRFLRWAPKPENEKRQRRESKDHLHWLFENQGIDYCQLCLRTKDELPTNMTLHVHHIVEQRDGGNDELQNLLYLCTFCHELAHLLRRNRRDPNHRPVSINLPVDSDSEVTR